MLDNIRLGAQFVPLELGVGRGDVAPVKLVEQQPLLAPAIDDREGLGQRAFCLDRGAHIGQEAVRGSALRAQSPPARRARDHAREWRGPRGRS